jgi:hypothetical protein
LEVAEEEGAKVVTAVTEPPEATPGLEDLGHLLTRTVRILVWALLLEAAQLADPI